MDRPRVVVLRRLPQPGEPAATGTDGLAAALADRNLQLASIQHCPPADEPLARAIRRAWLDGCEHVILDAVAPEQDPDLALRAAGLATNRLRIGDPGTLHDAEPLPGGGFMLHEPPRSLLVLADADELPGDWP